MQITLLDGAIGQELVKRSGDRATPLWSTQVMIDHPKLVGEVHLDYFAAGATIATTNTYAVLRDRLARVGLADQIAALTQTAVMAARRARAGTGGKGRIAGAIGPLVASYRPDLCPPPEEAAALYAEPVALMKDHVDLFLIETVSSIRQGEGALRACAGQGLPVWLCLSVDDTDGTKLRSGEALTDAGALIARHPVAAICLNCARPEAINQGLEVISDFGLPYGAYANGFTRISEGFLKDAPTVDALEERHDLGPEAYADFAIGWIGQGATIVGGCCEVGPAHIAALARSIRDAGHEIV